MDDLQWMDSARCGGLPESEADLFFSEDRQDMRRAARKYCDHCDVTKECLDYAFKIGDWLGVYGGMTPRERGRYERQWRRNRV